MKIIVTFILLSTVISCSQQEVEKMDREAEKIRQKIKKDKNYCSPVDKTLKTKGCEN